MAERTQDLDRATIERAFRVMGRELGDRKVFAEICMFGGSAMIFLFEWRKVSGDVDVVVRSGEHHGAVMAARKVAARELGLEESWLNDHVAQYAASLHDRDFAEVGVYPSYERPALRVVAARPAYVLAMKLSAMGDRSTPDDRDFHDASGIAAELGLSTAGELRETFRAYLPHQELSPLAEGRLDDVAQAARARRAGP